MKKNILIVCILVIALVLCFTNAKAYYGGYGGLMGMYGMMGMYGGYGGLMGMYGGMMGMYGGMMGMYGGLMGMYGGMMGMYGGMMGMYGGMMGMMGGMYSPFSYYNMYYPVQTTGGLTYQVPFMQIAPLLGVAGLYNQLFPNLFNPQPQLPPIVNVTTPTSLGVTFPTPVGILPVT
jgi:hypothetical protein